MAPRIIPMLPCADIEEMAEFWAALGFDVAYRQTRPNPYVALEGHGFPLHYYGLEGHSPETSHSTCGVIVDSTQDLFDVWAAGLRGRYGRLPISGYPRITHPRPRKNAGGASGFSLIDPAGNWIRVMRVGGTEASVEAPSPLRTRGDVAQADKILRGAVRRADSDDPAMPDAIAFLAELETRLAEPSGG